MRLTGYIDGDGNYVAPDTVAIRDCECLRCRQWNERQEARIEADPDLKRETVKPRPEYMGVGDCVFGFPAIETEPPDDWQFIEDPDIADRRRNAVETMLAYWPAVQGRFHRKVDRILSRCHAEVVEKLFPSDGDQPLTGDAVDHVAVLWAPTLKRVLEQELSYAALAMIGDVPQVLKDFFEEETPPDGVAPGTLPGHGPTAADQEAE